MSGNEGDMARAACPIRLLAESGRFGFACLDENFITQFRFGKIADWIPLGEDICGATPVFFGLEQELLRLKDEPSETLVLPKIGLNRERNDSGKVSMECSWREESKIYIISVYRIGDECDFEHDLVNQMRRARVAEENYRTASERLSEHENILNLLVRLPAAIAIFDRDLRYMFLTRRWAALFSLECEPSLGRGLYDSGSPLFSRTAHLHRRCLEGQIVENFMERIRRANGDRDWIRFGCDQWLLPDKSIGGLVIRCDICTEEVEERADLQKRNAGLLRANQELERFAAIISHDLRAPLRIIGREIKSLCSEPMPGRGKAPPPPGKIPAGAGAGPAPQHQQRPEQTKFGQSAAGSHEGGRIYAALDKILLQCERMTAMVTDLFDYSSFNEESRAARKINFVEFITDILKTMPDSISADVICGRHCAEIEIPVAPFDIVMRNLIENAARHHDGAVCNIVVAIEDRGGEWAFSVSDDGPGIPAAGRRDVCGAAGEASVGFHSRIGGLGLAIAGKTVALQGGRLNIASAPGERRGTVIEVLWPKPAPE